MPRGYMLWPGRLMANVSPLVVMIIKYGYGKLSLANRSIHTAIILVGYILSPDRLHIASGSEDNTVQIWNVNTKSAIFTYSEHVNGVHAIAWSPSGKYIASGSGSSVNYGADNSVRMWDSATGRTLYVYRGHQGPVLALAWAAKSPSSFAGQGSRIASGSKDGTVQIWQAI